MVSPPSTAPLAGNCSWYEIDIEIECVSDCFFSLQGYMPSGRDRRASTILDKRQQYWEIARQLWHDVDRTDLPEYERETLSQIKKDVNRTLRYVSGHSSFLLPTLRCYPLFQSEEVLESLRRILYIWSMRHPASV